MADDLVDFNERMQAQRVHIARLDADQSGFIENTVRLDMLPGNYPGEVDVFMTQSIQINTFLRSYAGMIAHEVRACLDGLASALARRNGQEPGSRTHFPIRRTEAEYRKYAKTALALLSDADQATITGFSPWFAANPLLYGLHEADRSRKHQRLFMSATGSEVNVGGLISGSGNIQIVDSGFPGGMLRNFRSVPYTTAARGRIGQPVKVLSGVPDGVDIALRLQLVYSEGEGIVDEPIVPSLVKFADQVDLILQAFE